MVDPRRYAGMKEGLKAVPYRLRTPVVDVRVAPDPKQEMHMAVLTEIERFRKVLS